MKTLFLILALALPVALVVPACKTAASERVTTYQTLAAVGQSAKAAIDASAQLLKQGQITVAQWQTISTFYDQRWQPAYALAVAGARADLSTLASPGLTALLAQLLTSVQQFTAHK